MLNNIAFDLDGIVANFSKPFKLWAKNEYGIEFIEKPQFHWGTIPKITDKMFKRIIAEFIRTEGQRSDLIKINVFPDGYDLVRYVWEKSCDPIYFVTARDKSTAGATYDWITRKFPSLDFALSIVSSGGDKWRYLERYDCFIDDRRKTAIDIAGRGKIVFMPRTHYNQLDDVDGFIWLCTGRSRFPVYYDDGCWVPPFQKDGAIIILDSTAALLSGRFDHLIFK